MTASTALEAVRMGASALGAVLALCVLALAWREYRVFKTKVATTLAETLRDQSDMIGSIGTLVRVTVYMGIQIGMYYIAQKAYYLPDPATLSDLARDSNLNQIVVIGLITVLTIWDGRDIVGRGRIEHLAQFSPPKRSHRRAKRETVEVEDSEL